MRLQATELLLEEAINPLISILVLQERVTEHNLRQPQLVLKTATY